MTRSPKYFRWKYSATFTSAISTWTSTRSTRIPADSEWVEKAGHDLVLADHELEDEIFSVAKVGVGYTLQLPAVVGWSPGIGAGASMSFLPDELEPD